MLYYRYFSLISIVLCLALCSCASTTNPQGNSYDETVTPGKTKLLNLTGQPTTESAAEVYFDASSRTEMMISFHDRLIAFQVDDVDLPGANGGYTPTGYQALALSPGIHTVSYCHTTRSDLGTGAVMCKFKIKDFNFEPGARYRVFEIVSVTHGPSGTGGQTMTVNTNIMKLK
jgi:hypothetical protein